MPNLFNNYYILISITVVIVCCYFGIPNDNDQKNEMVSNTFIHKKCDYSSYQSNNKPDTCGKIVIDNFLDDNDINKLLNIFNISEHYSSSIDLGGPTIFDLVSGALSSGNEFINFYKMMEYEHNNKNELKYIFKKEYLLFLRNITNRIKESIIINFNISKNKQKHLSITPPTFFSKIYSNRKPRKINDEYYHYHIDTEQYGSFCITTLIYLSDYGKTNDFLGGKFNFKNAETVTPKKGKLLLLSSGKENEHRVQNVTHGARIAFISAYKFNSVPITGKGAVFLSEKEQYFN